jgi:photosystem II stability/assembly factor-like uncharacterized protein
MTLALIPLLPLFLVANHGRQAPRLTLQSSGTTQRLQAVSVVDDRIAWVSGTGGTYLRTEDGGATWHAGVVPGADSLEFRDVQAFDARTALLLAAGPGDRSKIFRTGDGGATWAAVFTNTNPKAFYDCLAFVNGREGYVMADAIGTDFPVQQTLDGGRTWHPYADPGFRGIAKEGEGGFAASGTCMIAAPSGTLWIGTALGGRVLRRDAGRWTSTETPVVHGKSSAGVFSVAFRTGRDGVAAGGDLAQPAEATDNIAFTHDGGRTWVPGGKVTFPGPVYGVAYTRIGRRPLLVAVGPKGASWSLDDGGQWQPLDTKNYWGLGFAGGGVGWLVGPEGRIVRVEF